MAVGGYAFFLFAATAELAAALPVTLMTANPRRIRISYASDPMICARLIGFARPGPVLIMATVATVAAAAVLHAVGDPHRVGTVLALVASAIGASPAPVIAVTGRPRLLVRRGLRDVPSWTGELRARRLMATRTYLGAAVWVVATLGMFGLNVAGALVLPDRVGLLACPLGLWAACIWLLPSERGGSVSCARLLLGSTFLQRVGLDERAAGPDHGEVAG